MKQAIYPEITAELISKYDHVFGVIHQQPLSLYLSQAEDLLSDFCASRPEIVCHTRQILLSVGDAMMDALLTLCIRTCLDKLYHVREQLIGDTPESRYRNFIDAYLLPHQEMFFSPETALGSLVQRRINYSVIALREFLERLADDTAEIQSVLGLTIHSLDDVKPGTGDTHNSGKSVFIATVNGGERLVYKPHSTVNDNIMAALFSWFNDSGRLRLPLRHIHTLSRHGYGWQEFITRQDCQNTTHAENYMYRLGCLLFLSYLTNCDDLHMENLIAAGEHPFLVDTETLCANLYSLNGRLMEMTNSWDRMLRNSVFSSLLLPMDYLSDKPLDITNIGGILGGLADDVPQKTVPQLINMGTDQIGYALVSVSVTVEHSENIPILNEQRLHAGDYIEFVADGFQDAYHILLERKGDFLTLMDSGLFEAGVYRQLQRNTALYFKYLTASYHPAYINDRAAVYRRLKGTKDFVSPAHKTLVDMEIRQLLNDDVPYFYTTYRSTDLMTDNGDSCVDYFGKSVRQQLLDKVEYLSEVDLYQQLYFIRISIASPRYDAERNTSFSLPSKIFEGADLYTQRESVLQWIVSFRENYHRIDTSEEEVPCYFCLVPYREKNILNPETSNLYLGIGSFLFYLYDRVRTTGVSPTEALAQLEHEKKTPPSLSLPLDDSYPAGLFEGIGSYLYLNLYLYRLSGQDRYLSALNDLCDATLSWFRQTAERPFDVISGDAGLIIFALNAWEQDRSLTKLYELALFCGHHLYEAWKNHQLPQQTGFAHGYAGYSTALIMLGTIAGREDYYQAGMDLIHLENSYYNDSDGWKAFGEKHQGMNAWCYGAPGILVARESARPYAKKSDLPQINDDIAKALKVTKREVLTGSAVAVLCHGLPGNLEVLRWYAGHSGDDTILSIVAEGDERLMEVLRQIGIIYEVPAKVLNISFMVGLTGLGFYLLRTMGIELPSVLALEA